MVVAHIQDGSEAQWGSGKLSAWLLKRKSGNSRIRVRRYNKRLFTLDFDHKILSYEHAAMGKKSSKPIPFSELYDCTTLPSPAGSPATAEVPSRRPNLMKRFILPSSSKTNAGKDGIIVRAKGRFMELICSSPAEAAHWCEALQAAISSSNCGIHKSEDDVNLHSGKADLAEVETNVGCSSERVIHTEEDESPYPSKDAPESEKPPPAQHGTLFNLNADLDCDDPGSSDQGKPPVEVETVEEKPNIFQATDLGFEIGESDSDSEESVASSKGIPKEHPAIDDGASPRSEASDPVKFPDSQSKKHCLS